MEAVNVIALSIFFSFVAIMVLFYNLFNHWEGWGVDNAYALFGCSIFSLLGLYQIINNVLSFVYPLFSSIYLFGLGFILFAPWWGETLKIDTMVEKVFYYCIMILSISLSVMSLVSIIHI